METLKVVFADEVKKRLEEENTWTLLDVRKEKEVEESCIQPSKHLFLGDLPKTIDQLDKNQSLTVMCMSGQRATIGASLLAQKGFKEVDVFIGSLGAWQAANH